MNNKRGRKRKCSSSPKSIAKRPTRSSSLNLDSLKTKSIKMRFFNNDDDKTNAINSNSKHEDSYETEKQSNDEYYKNLQQLSATNSLKCKVQSKITSFFKMFEEKETVSNGGLSVSKIKAEECTKDILLATQDKKISNQRKRYCPFYKKVPDTSFCIDAFSYGSIPGIKYYFLSHFHHDHYMGLTKNFSHPLYCSKVTANLVSLKIKVRTNLLHHININEPIILDGVEVTALDANHCPGSLMFLFNLPDGRCFLHTGDFCATDKMKKYPLLLKCSIDEIYLDTTYCDPFYNFPSQDDVLLYVQSLVIDKATNNSSLLIVCGSYTVGKEKVFKTVAAALECKIWVSASKQKVLQCLDDDFINNHLVSSAQDAKVHVLPMVQLNAKGLYQHLEKFQGKFSEILALKPTGWEFNSLLQNKNLHNIKPKLLGSITIYGIPYSEHSSFEELKQFVQFLKPKRVIPTVNCGDKAKREEMNLLFNKWLNFKA